MSAYLSLGVVLRYGLSVFIAALPLFFASMVFSFHVRGRDQLGPILGVNLLGAVTGGVLEYISMLAGLKFLYFVAFLLYAVAYWAYAKPKVTWLRKLYAHPETLDRDSSA
jgi:O-antigen/teichoic acid export membrane protein